ncbi:MAG TPA: amidase family protein [Acetobacteraceae bacterium]|nr:amidase family protein [Acetobacteraceae bacterium]
MTDEDLCFLPAHRLATMIANRQVSPVEVMRAVLARIEALDPQVNAFATLLPEASMAAARRAEAAVGAGAALGRLHGVPVTIKDLTATRGIPTQRGSRIFAGMVPDEDAPLVTRLREAGAIAIGKTTTPEFGWTGVSRSPLTGITHNPWKHGYNAGASSAGAGAAAAAGFGHLHQGSDGAGSIRMPSHFCGVFGHKPSYGRVPYAPPPTNDATSHMGPMARTVRDAALMLAVMAGPHPADYTSLEAPPADYPGRLGGGIAGRRVAFSADLGHAHVDEEVAALVAQAVTVFADELGARVETVATPWAAEGPELARFFWAAHMAGHEQYLPEWEQRMDEGLVACIRQGAPITAARYQQMRERKMAYGSAINRWMQDWDLLLTPAVSVAAFPAGRLMPEHWPQHEWDWLSWAEFSYPFNMSHNPAASVPCGFTRDGLPVGLQIVGRRFDDLGVLQAAAAFERARPWADRRPLLAG